VLTGYASVQVFVATDSILAACKIKRNTALKMDAVTAANYKVWCNCCGSSRKELTLYSHFLTTSSFNRDDFCEWSFKAKRDITI
jgi:hypothetical protein